MENTTFREIAESFHPAFVENGWVYEIDGIAKVPTPKDIEETIKDLCALLSDDEECEEASTGRIVVIKERDESGDTFDYSILLEGGYVSIDAVEYAKLEKDSGITPEYIEKLQERLALLGDDEFEVDGPARPASEVFAEIREQRIKEQRDKSVNE